MKIKLNPNEQNIQNNKDYNLFFINLPINIYIKPTIFRKIHGRNINILVVLHPEISFLYSL
jgi:hypothetical protein